MPFSKGSVPDRLKGRGIPQNFVDQFIEVFNSIYNKSHDEGRAYRGAYSVMGKALRKAGYRRGDDGKWHKGTKEEQVSEELSHEEIREQLRELLLDHYEVDMGFGNTVQPVQVERVRPYIEAVYVNSVVFQQAGELWAFKYAAIDEVELSGEPVKVKKEYVPIEAHQSAGAEEIALSTSPITVVEETDKGARIRGVALVDEVISQHGHGRYYSKAFNDRCMAATNVFMAEGGTVTVYSRHGKAIPPEGQLSTSLPVGKVAKPLWRKGNEVWYEAFIAPTTEGKDVIVLLKTEVMTASSIRAATYRSRKRKMDGRDVEEMIDAVIVGIDLADEAGIDGAGVREVLEEAPTWSDEYSTREVTDMEWKDIDLKSLLENRKDLLEEYAASLKDVLPAQDPKLAGRVTELEAQVKTLTEEKGTLTVKLDAATVQSGQLQLGLKVVEAAQFGVSRIVAEELAKVVKEEADIAKLLPDIKTKAIALLLGNKPSDQVVGKGQTHIVEESAGTPAGGGIDGDALDEEKRTILSLSR